MNEFFAKMRGNGASPPRSGWNEIACAWLGSCLAMVLLVLLDRWTMDRTGFPLLIGSMGASTVLAFGAIRSPLAQPRNLVGGHVVSAIVGVTFCQLLPENPLVASCLAVATAIAAMHITKTLHPPGGATALIAVTGGEGIRQLGYTYVIFPGLAGSLLMLAVALVFNNIPKNRRYPQFWW